MAEGREITRRQFLKYGLAASAALAGGGLIYKSLYKGVTSGARMETKYKKVLVLGVDGMDPNITGKLLEDGRLPNLQALADSGTFTTLATSNPPNSPVAWTSIATGMNPGKHNIFDFIRRDPGTHMPELSLSKTKAGVGGTGYESFVMADRFWKLTSDAGIPTTVVRWPVTFPPEKVEGSMLGGLGVPDIKGFLSGYTYYTSGDPGESDKQSNKVVKVELADGFVNTELSGPKTRKSGEVVDVTVPLEVKLSADACEITVDGKTTRVGKGFWSDFIRAKFKVGMLKSVTGIFKAYLIGTDPFEMYVSAVQIDPENPVVDITSPGKYGAELAGDIGLYYTLGMPEETDGYVDLKLDSRAFLAQIADIEAQRDRMFNREFNAFKKRGEGVLAFVYDSSDRVQHVFWDEKVIDGPVDGLSVNDAVADYYDRKDEFIGGLVSDLDEDTLFLLISDHGFTSFERSVSLNTWLVENDYMKLKKELREGDEAPLFQNVDWSGTQAYSLGFNSIYVNLEGREGNGVVEDREYVAESIARDLKKLKDGVYGRDVVNSAYLRDDVYSGDYVENCPDVIVGFNPGYRMAWQTAIGGFTKEVLTDNRKRWGGDHLVDPKFVPGVLFSNARLSADSPSQTDVAPTVLDAVGLRVPDSIDGSTLIR
ncbi:MAG: twin-arginine translocation signal domain-containing protein [Candidatus Altiarchaeales archaeon]|nr:twin-arginine translocation signal domain-containing protein [Candidatus Altiarchaeales archaeon]MBD3416568.1 twin-arginine translocation signal domain-containing protein [Candidatus Altiarchaeales archaeon]